MPATRWRVFLIFLTVIMITAASPLSFNISPITPSDRGRFNFSGAALVGAGGIQVTPNEVAYYSIGRATYSEPLHLWDKPSANLTDFTTHFSFTIDSNGNRDYGDGMAFFLAPLNSTVQDWSFGGGLGLGYGQTTNSSTSSPSYPFVAVEFDTFLNLLVDPPFPNRSDVGNYLYPHVGIDVNSMRSSNYTPWSNDITKGFDSAWISYNATTLMLTVEFTGRNGSIRNEVNLGTYEVDLRAYLPEFVSVGFSAATGLSSEQHVVKSWSFSSTLQLHQSLRRRRRPNKAGLIAGLSAGLSVLVLILGSALAFFVLRNKKKEEEEGVREERSIDSSMDNELEESTGPRKFSYEELIISKLRHMNLVQLMGWCHQGSELLLVYEFMSNWSLDSHLFKLNSVLTWEIRFRIAQGLASALLYLHQELGHYVVHRDIKASNIMLDSNFNAKLGDFGLARLIDHDKQSETTIPAGTIGYMAPEYLATGRASKETDVYSFGIVLLEIACGRRPIDHKSCQNQVVLLEWVWSLYGDGQLLDAADPKLESSEHDARKIERLMGVGLWCAHPDSTQRPSMKQVMQVLDSDHHIMPDLPLPKPILYETGSSNTSSKFTTISAASTSDFLPR